MSTYYKFICKECNVSGGFLSRQAWGTGNFDIIETFKFLGLHLNHNPHLVSEFTEEYMEIPEECHLVFIEQTRGIMPASNDWGIVRENEWKNVEKAWEDSILEMGGSCDKCPGGGRH